MEAFNIQIIDPRAKKLLLNLKEMNLIKMESKPDLSELLLKLRRNENEIPTIDEITEEVELVRQSLYDKEI
jgi:hypothetical protein